VTSREPLHVESEQRYPVEPLPDDDAVDLFVQRARAVRPDFQPDGAVFEICRRLDGLPLAIELAAARVALLAPDELLARLDRRLPLLATRSRDAPARQRTLTAAIDWSHELLEPSEQALFASLAVFQGSFTTESAEAVCAADVDRLESLVEKSLIRRWGTGRLGMLETIHEYALGQLDASPGADDLRRRHAEHFLGVARSANLDGGAVRPGGQRVDVALADLDNFRGALAWVLDQDDIDLGLALAVALEQLWVSGDPSEGVRWGERLLAHPGAAAVAPALRAQALRVYGSALHIAGEHEAAERAWSESLAIFETLGDEHGEAVLLHRLGISAITRGDVARARELVERSDEIHRRTGDVWGRAQTVGTLGAIARDTGDAAAALALVRESAALAHEAEVLWWESGALAELACLSLAAGAIDDADRHARRALALADELHDRAGRIFCVGILAGIAAERGDSERAGQLWAAIEDEDTGAPLGGWRRHRDAVAARVKDEGGLDFARGYEAGRALSLDDAVAVAATP
jgi:predicted ATPase